MVLLRIYGRFADSEYSEGLQCFSVSGVKYCSVPRILSIHGILD